ncbi:sensor histidine kinase [Zobellia galactanivorans]|uniref:histidine kinase n=1 Tax=Zobellia galactanivorans (strain DSM 12802 / CCUG 47099 / CIP 106680 / NCIMB 13871 / Dsij) TaxID=63186 RepID=G0LC81_ZOBGA|nr:PAS domain-containing sensor histidine kinase [Zobellia galactanivorans]MBU3027655.1 PAS domain-containing sensor histidine kinase [Zobellia galactanivorans]CAZ96721.1 Two-component system-Sensor histidine kinase [Zobellia galactanivorans]
MNPALKAKHILLDPFFDLSMDYLCVAGFDGYFRRVNPAFVRLLGYSEADLYSKPIDNFIYEEDRNLTALQREGLIKNRPLVNFENRYVRKSGELVWLHWTSIPLKDEQLVYAIAKDVTHKKNMESERISHVARLSKINQQLKQLNYTTSHDLRSPVNNLLSLVEMIDCKSGKEEGNLQIIDYIKQSALGLKNSLNSYVDALKENEAETVGLGKVGLREVFEKVQGSISSLINNSKAKFCVDFSGMESVHFNTAYMESIFLNLITNSIKYMRPDVSPEIKIISFQEQGESILTFSDNGLGFDMDKVGGLIFNLNQRFHDTKDSKGVGLFLVHSHVTSLGGTIDVASKVNQGTTFTIKFQS